MIEDDKKIKIKLMYLKYKYKKKLKAYELQDLLFFSFDNIFHIYLLCFHI